jgi:acyl-coenzyme A thioesterase PaaI-like protein
MDRGRPEVKEWSGEGMVGRKGGPLADSLATLLKNRLGERMGEYRIPPPVFTHMQGEFVAFDEETATLTVRFPLLEAYLNPYDAVQGGVIAAAVDNTLGPLSMLVAPPNVTRRLEMTYSRSVTLDMLSVVVVARLVERRGRQLQFAADVLSPQGVRLARARATHWIVEPAES